MCSDENYVASTWSDNDKLTISAKYIIARGRTWVYASTLTDRVCNLMPVCRPYRVILFSACMKITIICVKLFRGCLHHLLHSTHKWDLTENDILLRMCCSVGKLQIHLNVERTEGMQ